MIAEIEKLDGSYENREMGDPICCEDYCDTCGDCLACYPHSPGEECATGGRWVIYIENIKNPYYFLEGGISWKNQIHQSHEMTEWENTIITITSTPRFGKIRECKKCGAEQAETVCGIETHDDLKEPCWEE